MAATTDLQTMLDLIDAQLLDMLASPKPDYSIDGKSVSWGSHFNNLMAAREKLRAQLIAEEGPSEIHVRGVT